MNFLSLKPGRLWVGIVLAVTVLAGAGAQEQPPPSTQPDKPQHRLSRWKRIEAPKDSARVIVKFKRDADLPRRHTLRTASSRTELAQKLAMRAEAIGTRLGLPLVSGRALDERTQVLMAQGLSGAELAQRLAQLGDVEYAVVDRRRHAMAVPNDPLYLTGGAGGPVAGQWYLREPTATEVSSINAPGAWDITTGDPSIVVAMLDTGVRTDHPDFTGRLLPGYDMIIESSIANDGDARDADASDPGDWVTAGEAQMFHDCESGNSTWHGTMTASILGASSNDGVGMAGVAWGVRLLPVRVLGKCGGYDSDIAAGMRWAAGISVPGVPDNPTPARVISMSLGGDGRCTRAEAPEYLDAIAAVAARGAIVVAAAGNTDGRAVTVPASCPGVVAVTSVRHVGTKAGFSSVGPEATISAPGGNCVNSTPPCLYPILAATNTGTQGPVSSTYTDGNNYSVGTSFSVPLVSGTIALMLSQRPALTASQVIATLKATARAFPSSGVPDDPVTGPIAACRAPDGTDQLQCYCTTSTCGAGMLDAAAAVSAVTNAVVPLIGTSPASPTVGQTVTLSLDQTLLPPGRTVANVEWTLLNGGGVATTFLGGASVTSTDATASITPTSAGTFTVQVTVIDDQGGIGTVMQAISVGAEASTSSGGGGGGAVSPAALLMFAFFIMALWVQNRKRVVVEQ